MHAGLLGPPGLLPGGADLQLILLAWGCVSCVCAEGAWGSLVQMCAIICRKSGQGPVLQPQLESSRDVESSCSLRVHWHVGCSHSSEDTQGPWDWGGAREHRLGQGGRSKSEPRAAPLSPWLMESPARGRAAVVAGRSYQVHPGAIRAQESPRPREEPHGVNVPWIAHRERGLPHPLLPLSTKGGALSLASRRFQQFPIPFTLAGVSPVCRGRPWRGGQGDGLGAWSWGVPQPVDTAVPPRGSRTVIPTFITFITWGRRV